MIIRPLFILQTIAISLSFVLPLVVQAQAQPSPVPLEFTPQIKIPNPNGQNPQTGFDQSAVKVGTYNAASGTMTSDLLPRYIMAIYNYGLAIAGILAALMLMGGGVIWLTSGGDAGRITQAKELITGSISGIVILVAAWMILNTVNPNLVNLKSIETIVIKKISYCCSPTGGQVIMNKDGKCPEGSQALIGNQKCVNKGAGNTNSFTAIDATKLTCCEYKTETAVRCITTSTTCPKTMPGYIFNAHHPGYYCGDDRVMIGNSCLAGNCVGKKDGDHCEGLKSDHCYNEICHFGIGTKVGDPCGGTLKGSKCDENKPQNGKTCNEDWSGRDCTKGLLTCCKFNTDGTRNNN